MSAAKPLAVAIAGPTATGKTDAAIAVCKALQGEVISMDSMQIYRGMDIGTAKPTPDEMRGVPHHMLSIIAPSTGYTVAEYQQDARRIMQELCDRNRLPVFAGGTGLYLQAVSHGLSFTQVGGGTEIRAGLEAEAALPDGPARLHAQLALADPVSAERLHPNNTRRVIRALEVYLTSGIPMSEQTQDWEAETPEEWLIFALTWPRETLYARINERVDWMLQKGLVAEVEALLESGVSPDAQAMKAIGYKEIVARLQGQCDLAEATETIKRNTRRYAKRQLTWLRRDARVRWVDLSAFASPARMHKMLINTIQNARERNDAGY